MFQELLQALANHLVNRGKVHRVRGDFDISVMTTLWILANPDTFRSVALRFNCQPGSVYFRYSYLIETLREMAPQYIKWPDAAERIRIAMAFEAYSGFPGIVGVIDGTHNMITAPVVQKRRYRNRYHTFSLNTQVLCDQNLLIRDPYIGEPGSVHDMRMLRGSPLYARLLTGNEDFIPPEEPVRGDGAYTLMSSLLVPFRNVGILTEQQRRYNRMFCRNRARIEHAFAKAFGQWRRMKSLHVLNMDVAVDHIMACFVLHNYMILEGEVLLVSLHSITQFLNDFCFSVPKTCKGTFANHVFLFFYFWLE